MKDSELRRVIRDFALMNKEARHSINDLNHSGQTAVQYALSARFFLTADALIELGAKARTESPGGRDLLYQALNSDQPDLFEELLRHETFDFEGAVQDRPHVIHHILSSISDRKTASERPTMQRAGNVFPSWEAWKYRNEPYDTLYPNPELIEMAMDENSLWIKALANYLNKIKPQNSSFYLETARYAFSLNLPEPAYRPLLLHTDWMKRIEEDEKQALFAGAVSTFFKTAELVFNRGGMTHLTVENQQELLIKWRRERNDGRIWNRAIYIGGCVGVACAVKVGGVLIDQEPPSLLLTLMASGFVGSVTALLAIPAVGRPLSICYDAFKGSRLSKLYPLAPKRRGSSRPRDTFKIGRERPTTNP